MFTNRDVPDADLFLDVDEPDQLWKSYNDAAYKVMKKYGDGHKQVLLTESGFTGCGNPEWEGIHLISFSRSPADTSKGLLLFSTGFPNAPANCTKSSLKFWQADLKKCRIVPKPCPC